MTNQLFDNFLDQQVGTSTDVEISRKAELEEWQKYLAMFHENVERFLKPYVDTKKLKLEKRSVELHEEYIGPYQAEALDIFLGINKIVLTPIGTNLIGAKGRVDMTGPKEVVRLTAPTKVLVFLEAFTIP